ncbi:hypothetical protein LHP98_13720 [Rhodobacter sp. Har01]|uniref:hypothetical protein n=1 Tax=Rhodobacter sp. Har01 TaxID=2883999 RepID=UPI001D065BB8|nr:hypothetical protein [Rhodobacter sp. Har01]MCB6179179.1 hypothetical protein [Rhodobacter sp. Har01]
MRADSRNDSGNDAYPARRQAPDGPGTGFPDGFAEAADSHGTALFLACDERFRDKVASALQETPISGSGKRAYPVAGLQSLC